MSTTEKLLELAHRLAAMVSTRQVRAGDAVQTMVDAIESVFVDDAQGTETLISLLSDQYDRINAAALPYRVEYATLVASVALRFPFPKWIGWTHHDLGKLLNSLGRHREAKASFETAIASWGAAYPDFVDVARGDLGATMRLLVEFTTAEPLLREALEAASRAGSIHNVLQWSLELGNTLTFTSRNREADEIFRRGLELARLTSNPAMEAAILTGLANVRENEGRYDECIGYHEAALAISRASNDQGAESIDLLNLGNVFTRLARFEEAYASYRAASELATRAGNVATQAMLANAIGSLLMRSGDHEAAEGIFRRGLPAVVEAGDRYLLSRVLGNLGNTYQLLGDFDRSLQCHLRSLENSRETDDVRSAAQDLVNLSRVAHLAGDESSARGYAAEALELAAVVGDPFITCSAEHRMATTLARWGSVAGDVVWGHFQRAMRALESPRAFVAQDADRVGMYSDGKHRLYEDAVLWLLDRTEPGLAMETAERAKSRLLLDGIAERATGGLSIPDDSAALLSRVRRGGARTTYASLFVTEEETVVFLVAGEAERIEVRRVPVSSREWDEWLASWRESLEAWRTGAEHPGASRPRAVAMLGELDDMLMREVREWLDRLANVEHLVLVPHRSLHAVPLHSAYDRESGRYLADGRLVSYLPALQLLADGTRPPERHSALVLSAPATTLGPLPHAKPEAEVIERLFGGVHLSGEAATVEAFASHARDATLIHLSCHAAFDERRPDLSSFILAGGTRLTAYDVGRLGCARLDLVVSAACESARSRPGGVDEALGLSRAWLLGGARTVVGMLWEVGDEAAHRFMRLFYERVAAGEPYALAYRTAQREFLRGDAFDRDGRYWGAFTLTSTSHPMSAGLPT